VHAAVAQPGQQVSGPLLAVDLRYVKVQALFGADVIDDAGHPPHSLVGPAGAAGTDDERDPGLACRPEQDSQVQADRTVGGLGLAGAKVVGARVGGTPVHGDDVGTEGQTAGDGRGIEPGTEHAARHQYPDAVPGA
jgi:hypothetical protein